MAEWYNVNVNVKVKDKLLRIGDLSRASGKTARALRYYEELGLLHPSSYTEGGFRLYAPEEVTRVRFIERLQEIGFSLDQIRQMMQAWASGREGVSMARNLHHFFSARLQEMRQQMQKLKTAEAEMEEALRFLQTCIGCFDPLDNEACLDCQKGDHQAEIPPLVEVLARSQKRAEPSALSGRQDG